MKHVVRSQASSASDSALEEAAATTWAAVGSTSLRAWTGVTVVEEGALGRAGEGGEREASKDESLEEDEEGARAANGGHRRRH